MDRNTGSPLANAWRATKNDHNFVHLTLQVMRGATVRNLSAVPMSLASQPFPFRHPLIKPVTGYRGHNEALELRRALRVRLGQSTH
eukprot:196843-Pyramimonas_sp.AAC.1